MPVPNVERLRALAAWLEIAKVVPQMTEKRCDQFDEALKDAIDALEQADARERAAYERGFHAGAEW